MKGLLFALSLAVSWTAQGKKFSSQFCEFDLPDGWECDLEGSEWVCQSGNKDRRKEAIVILAAKERGEEDSLDAYQAYLKQKKVYKLPGGKNIVSEMRYANTTEINDHTWIDAMHLQSEIPGYYTRYLATVKERLGVGVTFTVSKGHYNAYKEVFDRMVGSLKVFAPAQYTDRKNFKLGPGGPAGDVAFVPDDQGMPDLAVGQKRRPSSQGSMGTNMLVLLALAAGAGVFIVMRKRRAKKGKGA